MAAWDVVPNKWKDVEEELDEGEAASGKEEFKNEEPQKGDLPVDNAITKAWDGSFWWYWRVGRPESHPLPLLTQSSGRQNQGGGPTG